MIMALFSGVILANILIVCDNLGGGSNNRKSLSTAIGYWVLRYESLSDKIISYYF